MKIQMILMCHRPLYAWTPLCTFADSADAYPLNPARSSNNTTKTDELKGDSGGGSVYWLSVLLIMLLYSRKKWMQV